MYRADQRLRGVFSGMPKKVNFAGSACGQHKRRKTKFAISIYANLVEKRNGKWINDKKTWIMKIFFTTAVVIAHIAVTINNNHYLKSSVTSQWWNLARLYLLKKLITVPVSLIIFNSWPIVEEIIIDHFLVPSILKKLLRRSFTVYRTRTWF